MNACPTTSRRVLLVEDNRDNRETLRMVLELWGHRVEVAEDGGEGVRKALSWNPEVAIVDIGLPVLNGYRVAQQVREVLRDRILLIALTAYAQPEDRERALAWGFNVHLAKPADMNDLARLLEQGGETV